MRFTTIAVALFVAVAAAKPHSCPAKDPCKKVHCDWDEECKVQYGKGVCVKKDGNGHGGHDGHNSNPCATVRCQFGACKVEYGKAVCPKDPCAGYDCGYDKVCKVENNKPVCKDKDDGGHGGNNPCMFAKCAFGPCRVEHGQAVCPKDPCDRYDCGRDKVCKVENNKPVCKDDGGHGGNNPCMFAKCAFGPCRVEHGQAVCPKDPCDGYDCGYDKECKVIDNKAVCKDKDNHPTDPCATVKCLWGTCEVVHGKAQCPSKPPVGPKCGKKNCLYGEVCCNSSCGICTKPGMSCPMLACV